MHRIRGDHSTTDEQSRSAGWALMSQPSGGPNASGARPVKDQRALEEQLAAVERERDELHEALFQAAQVQRKLCAPRQMRRGRFEIASEIFPVRYISGDFYDVQELGETISLAVGDIAGKGLAAGLWFAHLMGLIRIHAAESPVPAATMAAIHRDLYRLPSAPPIASLFLGRLDSRRGELIYCNAGQPPALLLRRDGSVEWLREGGPLLGAFPQASFRSGRVVVEPGDTLIVYTDGIVECRPASRDGGEEFGVRRLLAAARSADRSSAGSTLFSVLGAVQDFAGSHPAGRDDDFTLMVVRRLEEGPAPGRHRS